MADYDVLGNIAILKSDGKTKKQIMIEADKIFSSHSGVKTVLSKDNKVSGRLRTIKVKHVKGEKNFIVDYIENNCRFVFDVRKCYFSPRLAGERKLIAERIKSNDKVLVMFAGVGVYPIVIYKTSRPIEIVGIELGRECCKYFKKNLELNKIPVDRVKIIQGDVKKKITKDFGKFDVVVMARPNLKDSFLEYGLYASKKETKLFYYAFSKNDRIDDVIKNLITEAKKFKRNIKFIKKITAGDIAPYKYRYRIEFKVLD